MESPPRRYQTRLARFMTAPSIPSDGPTPAARSLICVRATRAEYAFMISGTCKTTSCSCSGTSRNSWKSWGKHYAQSPMAASDVVANIGDVSALSMQRYELLESRFYREVLKPFGLLDIIWFPALRTGGRMASLHA